MMITLSIVVTSNAIIWRICLGGISCELLYCRRPPNGGIWA